MKTCIVEHSVSLLIFFIMYILGNLDSQKPSGNSAITQRSRYGCVNTETLCSDELALYGTVKDLNRSNK